MKQVVDRLILQQIERKSLLFRGHKVLLDADLADLYAVEKRVLAHAVKRIMKRFPEDFMFQLSQKEVENWRSQFVMSKPGVKMGMRRPPYAFTEQGVAILSSVLRSARAVSVNVQIMRAVVNLREMLSTHKDLAHRPRELEEKYDEQFAFVFDAIRKLMEQRPVPKKRRIGFIAIVDDD